MLAEMYGWTFEEIANMTSHQQIIALGGDEPLKFGTYQEYRAWKQQNG